MSKYEIGKTVVGTVTGIEKYGVFVSLDDYYSGLIHISEISSIFVKDINDYVQMGETIKMKIVDIDEKKHQIKLSIKNIEYRINRKRRTKIVETGNGFSTLSKQLPKWIEKKTRDLSFAVSNKLK